MCSPPWIPRGWAQAHAARTLCSWERRLLFLFLPFISELRRHAIMLEPVFPDVGTINPFCYHKRLVLLEAILFFATTGALFCYHWLSGLLERAWFFATSVFFYFCWGTTSIFVLQYFATTVFLFCWIQCNFLLQFNRVDGSYILSSLLEPATHIATTGDLFCFNGDGT